MGITVTEGKYTVYFSFIPHFYLLQIAFFPVFFLNFECLRVFKNKEW